MKLLPYWLDGIESFAAADPGPVAGEVDVAVIGGGFTGLSAALALARAGARVVVLEAGRVAQQASGRNGGHVNNGTAIDIGAFAAKYGTARARALYRAYDDAVDTVERIVRDHQIACDFRRGGKIKLAAKPAHYEAMARGFAFLNREIDPETDLIARSDVADHVGSDAFFGGLLYRKSAQMHVGRFGRGLAEAAHRAGARIFEHAPVTALHRLHHHAHRVTTARGSVVAKQVLLATGPSRHGPFARFRRRIVPIGSFIVATAPLAAATAAAVMPGGHTATTSLNVGNYFRLTPDHRLVFGGRARFALSSPVSDRKSGRILEAALRRIFPQLAPVPIEYCWGGIIDLTADRLPRAGEHAGLFYAMGYSGHGVQMSVHMGERMAAVMGGDAGANPLRDLPWPPIPGHFGPPWFLPLVGAYYRAKDRFG